MGAGIGGVPCAYELRKQLGKEHQITVIGSSPRFEFTPSNPWMMVGWRTQEDTSVA
jgi:sulfide:quinone oxidoreductase